MPPRPNPVARAQQRLLDTTRVSLLATLQQAYAEVGFSASKGLLQALNRLAEPPSRVLQAAMYERLGQATLQAVLDQYDSEIGNNPHARYRAGTDPSSRLTGRLRPVLASNADGAIYRVVTGPNSAGGVRIQLFHTRALDARARHWARLEFGAGSRAAGGQNVTYRVAFRAAPIILRMGGGPRPAFRIPRGYWYEGGEQVAPGAPVAGSAFYLRPLAKTTAPPQTPKITQGFAGRRYLQAGLAEFASRLAPEFNAMLRQSLGQRTRLRFTYSVTARAA